VRGHSLGDHNHRFANHPRTLHLPLVVYEIAAGDPHILRCPAPELVKVSVIMKNIQYLVIVISILLPSLVLLLLLLLF
jgi:hypothetical protein